MADFKTILNPASLPPKLLEDMAALANYVNDADFKYGVNRKVAKNLANKIVEGLKWIE